MSCPGYVQYARLFPKQESGRAADMGTAVHKVVEQCLRDPSLMASSFEGHRVNGFVMDEELIRAATFYVNYVRGFVAGREGLFVEEKVELSWVHRDIWGTADAFFYDQDHKVLHVFDYKNGSGVFVEAEWNPQLMIYAAGVVSRVYHKIADVENTTVSMHVIQPRYDFDEPVRRFDLSLGELMLWAATTLKTAAKNTEQEGAPLVAGEQCTFCECIALCPAYEKHDRSLVLRDFEPLHPVKPEDLSPEQIAYLLEGTAWIKRYCEAVAKFAHAQATQKGIIPPRHKLVASVGNRAWDDETRALSVLSSMGVPKEKVVEVSLRSPAQVEKIAVKYGVDKTALSTLYSRPSRGLALVRETDKRPAIETGVSFSEPTKQPQKQRRYHGKRIF